MGIALGYVNAAASIAAMRPRRTFLDVVDADHQREHGIEKVCRHTLVAAVTETERYLEGRNQMEQRQTMLMLPFKQVCQI